jgi:hypothetical protein
LIIEYEGKSYPYDFDDITVRQAIMIERHVGMTFSEWSKSVGAGGDLAATQAVGWLVLLGGDLARPIEECDFKLSRLGEAFARAAAAEAEKLAAEQEAEAAGPTPPPVPPSVNGDARIPALSPPS